MFGSFFIFGGFFGFGGVLVFGLVLVFISFLGLMGGKVFGEGIVVVSVGGFGFGSSSNIIFFGIFVS